MKRNTRSSRRVADAATSNAGDDFHLQWAARRALSLLLPGTQLTGIVPEAPTPVDSAVLDSTGEKLLAIDLTEYFGGNSFAQATRVVYSQLKYSTTHAHAPWTISALTTSKKGTAVGSVLYRLADLFQSHLEKFGRDSALAKLNIWLVSNRPCDVRLETALAEVRNVLSDGKPTQWSQLVRKVSSTTSGVVSQLKNACTQLQSSEFCDFLRVLDLSSRCGEVSRLRQELALTKDIGQHGFFDTSRQRNDLKSLIWDYSQPGTHEVITVDHIARTFRVLSKDVLFPAPNKIERLPNPVPRKQAPEIAKQIVESKHRILCVHGDGGIGKSTLVQSLVHYLPDRSVVVTFDCYGAGTYLNAGQLRHQHEHALTQIGNELAVTSGTELLLNREMSVENLIRWFRDKLEYVARSTQSDSPQALVVVVVDAADNSVSAARQKGERSFVTDLVTCQIPDGCRLVITCRSHRRRELGLPSQADDIPLQPFNQDESRQNLCRYFASPSSEKVQEFHRLSRGIPRVQGYALDGDDSELDSVLSRLRPDGKSLDSVLSISIEEAILKSGDRDLVSRVCQALILLPRPVPPEFAARFARVDPIAVIDVTTDLGSGLICDDQGIQFRDEDFETYLTSEFSPGAEACERISDILMEHRAKSAYAATALPEVLYLAKKDRELIDLVEKEGHPAAILDPIARNEAFARRARLAVRAAVTLQDRVALFRLLFAVAQANKSDRAVESLLVDNVDLAYMHGDPATIQRIYLNEKNNRISWFGATHMRCAGLCSRNKATLTSALKHLEQARGWLDEWMRLPEEKRRQETITSDELAYLGEAVLRLHGFDAAVQCLSRWRPAEFVLDAARKLAHNVAFADRQNAFSLVHSTSQRHDVLLVIIEAAMDLGLTPSAELVTALRPHLLLLRQLRPLQRSRLTELIIPACEAAAQLGEPMEEWCAVLSVYLPPPLRYLSPYSSDDEHRSLDLFLRGHVLLSAIRGKDLKPDDPSLLPTELRPAMTESKTKRTKKKALSKSEVEESKRLHERRAQFVRRYMELIPAYAFRAQVLLRKAEESRIAELIDGAFNARGSSEYYYLESEGKRIRASQAAIVVDGLIRCQRDVSKHFELVRTRIGKDAWWDLRLRLADRATARPELSIAVLDLIDSVGRDVCDSQTPGQEKTSALVRCCRIASVVDPSAGQHYFGLAVEAAAEIDDEAFGLLRLIASLASRARKDSPMSDFGKQAAQFSQVVENCHWRLEGWDHFPWDASINGLTNLSPGVAACCLCRWDQRGIRGLNESSITWAKTAIETAGVHPAFVFALNLLAYPGSDEAFGISLSAATQPIGAKNQFRLKFDVILQELADYATREAPFSSRYALARSLLEWADANGCESHPALASVRALRKLKEQIDSERTYETSRDYFAHINSEKSTEPEIDWDSLLRLHRFVNVGEITQLLVQLRDQHGQGDDHWVPPKLLEKALEAIAIRLTVHEFCSHLEALMSVDSELLPSFVLQEVLASRWQLWKVHPKVREWFDSLARRLASERFDEFFWHDCFDSRWLCELRDQLEIPTATMLHSLTVALTERDHLRLISPAGLYDFAQSLIQTLANGEAAQILVAVLSILTEPIREEGLACAAIDLSQIPLAGTELEAASLWFLFGHPDKRIRWRAIHAARRMIRVGHTELLQQLAAWLSKGRSHPFSIPKTTFYWLSARQHFFLLLDRLASELPNTLIPIADAIAEEVISPKEPHALVLQFAKRAAVKLVKHGKSLQDKTLRGQLAKSFKSPFPVRLATRRKPRPSRKYGEGRFDFESTDTIPYWFEPLARVFDVGTEEICQAVERFVCDEWNSFGRAKSLDKVREWHGNDREWNLFTHRHGEDPTIESLDRYLEFHGMMCAAASLLREKRTYRNEWGDYSWKTWIGGWELSDKDEWVADRRQATPLERIFHIETAIKWGTKLRNSDFDRIIGLVEPLHKDSLMVWGNWSRWHYEGYEDVTVQSALVSPETSRSLLEALHFSSDPFDCWLPTENPDSGIHETIGGIQFSMKGWITEKDRDSYGIEEHDPLRFGFKRRSVEPGIAFQTWGSLTFDEMKCTTFRNGSVSDVTTRREEWNDFESGGEERRLRTDGVRFWVTISELLAFLSDTQQSLIVSCTVYGKVKKFGSDDTEKDLGPQKKLYLCHSDGIVETIGRSHRIGKATRR